MKTNKMSKYKFYLSMDFLVVLILVSMCYYGLYRNMRVKSYKDQLVVQRLWMDLDNHDDYIKNIESRYTYWDFFFSFKPMESRYWFSQEEIDKYQLELVDEASELHF